MITADTITDEMIRELRNSLPVDPAYGGFEWQRAKECAWAIRPEVDGDAFINDRRKLARGRAAEILNARAAK